MGVFSWRGSHVVFAVAVIYIQNASSTPTPPGSACAPLFLVADAFLWCSTRGHTAFREKRESQLEGAGSQLRAAVWTGKQP